MTPASPATFVFIHGLFHGFRHFEEMSLPGPGRIVVIDLLGYGWHAGAEAPESLHEQVRHVAAELARFGASPGVIVGHSVGGAVAMLLAATHPDRVAAIVNVEGNFTLADAFWSSKFAAMSELEAETTLDAFRQGVPAWLLRQKIDATPERVAWARRMFDAQPASSLQALGRAVVRETTSADYLPTLDRVLESGIPVHLLAGERSRGEWSVHHEFAGRAASFTVQPDVGHMMPIEDPEGFLALIASRVR